MVGRDFALLIFDDSGMGGVNYTDYFSGIYLFFTHKSTHTLSMLENYSGKKFGDSHK